MKINTPCSVYEKYPSQQHKSPLDKIKLNSYIFSTTATFYTHCYVNFLYFDINIHTLVKSQQLWLNSRRMTNFNQNSAGFVSYLEDIDNIALA